MVYVSLMLPRKDIHNIVRPLAVLIQRDDELAKTVKLLVVGGETVDADPIATPEIGELQRLAAELGVTDQLCCVGKRQQDLLRYYYSAIDIAVTTPCYEPFGLSTLEALSCARPVIGSAVGGTANTTVTDTT